MSVPSNSKVLRRLFWKLFFRGRTTSRRAGQEGKLNPHGMWITLGMHLLVGIFPCLLAGSVDVMTYSALLHGTTLFMVVFHMITTAGSVLFNKEEAEILLHRPVKSRELLRAKAWVLCGVAALLAAALNLPGMVMGVYVRDAHWWFPLAHAVSLMCMIVFSAGALVVVYQACLRWIGRDRLDNLMTTLQTVLTVLLVVGSQSFRLLRQVNLTELRHAWWLLGMPPTWFAALDTVLAGKRSEPWMFVAAAGGLAATAFVAWLGFHRLASTYSEGLMMLNEAGSTSSSDMAKGRRPGQWLRRLQALPPLRWWLKDPVQKSAFTLVAAYMVRDRETKLRLYPGMAQVLALPLVFMMVGTTTGASGGAGAGLGAGAGVDVSMAGIYLGWLPLMGLQMLAYSEHWRAAELFSISPGGRWQPLFHGARKAVLVLMALPMILGLLLLVLVLRGWSRQMLLLLPNILLLPLWSMVPGLMESWRPLAKPFDATTQARFGCLAMAAVMAVSGVVGMAGWGAMKYHILPEFILGLGLAVGLAYWGMGKVVESKA